jgi:hypothetical protein
MSKTLMNPEKHNGAPAQKPGAAGVADAVVYLSR